MLKVSELIIELQKQMKEHGDLYVFAAIDYEPVGEVGYIYPNTHVPSYIMSDEHDGLIALY
jgi:hypothetical protein